MYEQLEFDYDPPVRNTRIWVMRAGEEYGYGWMEYTNLAEFERSRSISYFYDYEWVQDEYGKVYYGHRDEDLVKRYGDWGWDD